MKILTQHPRKQGMTYYQHWQFAMGIAWRLLKSVWAFALHALIPAIPIERQLDLEATEEFLNDCNDHVSDSARQANKRIKTVGWPVYRHLAG